MPESYTLEQAELDIAQLRGQVAFLSEILALQNGPTPNTPASGEVDLFASGGQPNYINSAGLQMGLQGAQNATFPGTTVTQAALTTLATATVPANDAEAGAVYELECEGNWTQATGTAVTMEFAALFAGNTGTNQTIGITGFNAGGTGRFWARVRVYCITAGAAGSFRISIRAVMCPNANPNNTVTIEDNNTVSSINTTVAQTLAVQYKWGSTTGSPSIINQAQVFKRIA